MFATLDKQEKGDIMNKMMEIIDFHGVFPLLMVLVGCAGEHGLSIMLHKHTIHHVEPIVKIKIKKKNGVV